MKEFNKILSLSILAIVLLLLSAETSTAQILTADTIPAPKKEKPILIRSPKKATLYAAICPGLGQIYNRKYWKLPLLYGGLGATLYGLNWNLKNYNKYKDAYLDFSLFYEWKNRPEGSTLKKPTSERYKKVYAKNFDYEKSSDNFDRWFKTQLQNRKDSFKHDRDLCYIILGAIYILNIVDASVDAHLSGFNVNDDLSINVIPTTTYSYLSGNTVGISCQITF